MVKYLRAANVKDGELDLSDVMTMNFTPSEQRIFRLRPGDVLVTEGSGSLNSVGASAVWQGGSEDTICFQNTLLRMRPRAGITDGRFLGWWARSAFGSGLFASLAGGANIYHLSAERVRAMRVDLPPVVDQRRIANFLDAEIGKLDKLVSHKAKLLELLEERIDNSVLGYIGDSQIVRCKAEFPVAPIRRLLLKHRRRAIPRAEIVTAFRDGQVTARSLRRAEGYTLSASAEGQGQYVEAGDVVVHGLDGFAGAIGTSEASGNCSAVYHVCGPRGSGDSVFLGRLLRVLAKSDYLGLFATSTRERAVDFRNWDLFGRIPIPDVPLHEQMKIRDLVRSVGPLRAAIERTDELAKGRRQALITAAVTGQIDVTTARGVEV
jgi:type I restriction enzyme S subunit